MAKIVSTFTGEGRLSFRGLSFDVSYTFKVVRDGRRGRNALVGSITGDALALREAFKSTCAQLHVSDGSEHSIDIIAHSEGGSVAFFMSRDSETIRTRGNVVRLRAGDPC